MTACFADSFYFIALLNPADADHSKVVQVTRTLSRPIVTTAWVLTEVADAFSPPSRRHAFQRLVEELMAEGSSVSIIPASKTLFEMGLDFYFQRMDKAWSLTDCTSFVVMKQNGMHDALTGDHHFEQAGFVALLRP